MKLPNYSMMRPIKNLLGHKSLLFIALTYTLAMSIAQLLPVSGVSTLDIPYLDKLVHVLLHFILVNLWLYFLFFNDGSHFYSKKVALALVLCFFYGIVIEAFQHWFTLTRTFDLFDIIANGIGDLLGFLSFRIVRKKIVQGS